MRLVVWPFCSQQNKVSGEFLLSSCGACKQLAFLVERIEEELRWHVTAVLPHSRDRNPFKCRTRHVRSHASNERQRIDWSLDTIGDVLYGADIALLNNELMAVPVRTLFPKLKIVQMCSVLPDMHVFQDAWDRADLVVAQGDYAARRIGSLTPTRVTAWKLAYDERLFQQPQRDRDIDLLFVQRCSATNYTHHTEFMEAVRGSDLRIVYTDVTHYLRREHPNLEYTTPETYTDALHRSKYAIALNDNWYGGLSIREACRAGCSPIVLDVPCYRELCGDGHPNYAAAATPTAIAAAIFSRVQKPVHVAESYQEAWPKVKADLEAL